MFNNVVVGVDGRGGGRDAIALSKRLLERGGRLTLAHVYSGDTHTRPGAPTKEDLVKREGLAEMLEAARKEAGTEQADLRWREASSAGRGLHELSELIQADLLVVGSAHRGLLGRVLLHARGTERRAVRDRGRSRRLRRAARGDP